MIAAIDETGQEKTGAATAGVKRQYMGCAGRVANGINTVHVSLVREKAGHALIGARQWIAREHIADPVTSLVTGCRRTWSSVPRGSWPWTSARTAAPTGCPSTLPAGTRFYGSCTRLREFFEEHGQAYVLRVASNFMITLAPGTRMTCADAVNRLLKDQRRWEVRSAGKGSRGERWYAWAWIAAASPRHHLLVRRHLKTGELAFHYCYVPEGQLLTKTRLVRAAGLRWPVEEDFRLGKDCLGLDQCQARLYTAIQRHIVLVMAALAICAVTAARLKDRTDAQAPLPVAPGQAPPPDPGMIPLTVPEIKRLLAAALVRRLPVGHARLQATASPACVARWPSKRGRARRPSWASSSPTPRRKAGRWSTGNFTCRNRGRTTGTAAARRACPMTCSSPPKPSLPA